MTKDVLVTIGGLQMAPDDDSDTVEVIAPGEYYFRNSKHYLLYEDVADGEVTKNIIKIGDKSLEVVRKGPASVHMVFEEGKKNMTYYSTPFGSIPVAFNAKEVSVDEDEEVIKCNVKYSLEINYEHAADCDIHIEARQKGSKGFKIASA